MEGTFYTIIPPIAAILMVVLTRRVLLSLGVGILVGAWVLTQSIGGTFSTIFASFKAVFISDGALNTWNVYILLFLVLLGIMTAFITISGGSRAFGEWAMNRVKTRAGAQLVTAFLGIIIFIDDYFNSLAVGQVSRPLTDRHRISRAKLAYLIDSTSAPICVISPVSSWGAYIIALIGSILVAHEVTDVSAFTAFIQMIPMNLYVFVAILLVFATAIFNIDLFSMKKHEKRAIDTGEVVDSSKGDIPGELKSELPMSKEGKVTDLVVPIISLIIGTVTAMIYTGVKATEGPATILSAFENTDVAASLVYGGTFGLVVTLLMYARHKMGSNVLRAGLVEGTKSMLPAIYILIFAWVIVDIIGQLGTGEYLAEIVKQSNMNIAYLPVVLFLLSGVMAFATGTSWGTFGIMLPIAGEIAAATDITLLLPALSAVLAGSVFGDHCSPISDTTILSSTGAGAHHIDHVLTQLPYAILSAIIASIGYIALGLTGSTLVGLGFSVALLVVVVFIFRSTASKPA
ncbi:Na+/H+ antiporter NhaC family protein [Bacillus solimangrovi]|uniref:Sodium:proton antiporter n=1 Tax=Bacillus solimangrovi TaxID=1305675 RepID=A0A1E5LIQ6_9BACI|nr:Na+/H+ antiporter NhaC family protein [Bacillus solimangrovi]OEH93964.1 sodium:proton antiporter [Bacillus solimangrovi]